MELTTQPLSIRTTRRLRRLSSMPQASPVGPAPTTTTSKVSAPTSQHPFYRLVHLLERASQSGRILAAGFRHIGPAAAFSADG